MNAPALSLPADTRQEPTRNRHMVCITVATYFTPVIFMASFSDFTFWP